MRLYALLIAVREEHAQHNVKSNLFCRVLCCVCSPSALCMCPVQVTVVGRVQAEHMDVKEKSGSCVYSVFSAD